MRAGALRQTHLLSCSLPLGCSCCPGQRLLLLLSRALLQGEPGHVPARVGRSLHGRLRQHAQPPCRPGAPVAVGPAAAARRRAAGRSRAREARADAALPISAGQASNFDRHSPRARRAGVPAAGVPVCRGRVHDAGGELPAAAHRAAQGAPRRPRRALLWARGCRVSCCPARERRLCGVGPPSSSLLPLAAGCQSVGMQAVWLLMRWRFLLKNDILSAAARLSGAPPCQQSDTSPRVRQLSLLRSGCVEQPGSQRPAGWCAPGGSGSAPRLVLASPGRGLKPWAGSEALAGAPRRPWCRTWCARRCR